MKDGVVCFGELMIRLGANGYEKLIQSNQLDVKYTGAEANVGISCANYGLPAFAVSMVPSHDIGQACINYLRRYGLNTDYVFRGGKRIGILYTETGCSQRPSKVIYDRENSSITELKLSQEEWKTILKDKSWFHFSGTAPALGQTVVETLRNGLIVAKQLGLTTSVDYNYRSKLWSKAKAKEVMESLMPYVDVGIGNEEDCGDIFGVHADNVDIVKGTVEAQSYSIVASKMVQKYNLKCQAITLRESHSATSNGWAAIISDGSICYKSKHYDITIVDRIGGGDSFSGGLIFQLSKNEDYQLAIDFAVAASALKQTIVGDFNLSSIDDVNLLMNGNSSGRVQR